MARGEAVSESKIDDGAHVWTVKPGLELHGGSSLPTHICCEKCGAHYTLYYLSTEPGQAAANEPCTGHAVRA